MLSVIFETVGMMVFAFAIGFAVAGVISLLVRGAESSNLWRLKKDEIRRIRRIKSARKSSAILMASTDELAENNELVNHYYSDNKDQPFPSVGCNDLVKMFFGKNHKEVTSKRDWDEQTKNYHYYGKI